MNDIEGGTVSGPETAQKGDITRQNLILSGLELFGERGFSGTSTRAVCRRADANVAAIPYYFGGKEGLYLAVAEYIADRVEDHIAPVRDKAQDVMAAPHLDESAARDMLHEILQTFAHMYVDTDEPKSWALIVMREQIRPTKAFDYLYDRMMGQMCAMLSGLIGVIVGLDGDSDEARMRAHAMMGQILVFLSSRETVLRSLGITQLGRSHVDLMLQILHGHIEACLNVAPVSRKRETGV